MADFLKTFSILALVFSIGCSGKTGFEPDDFPTYVELDGVSLRINYVQNSNSPLPVLTIDFATPERGRVILTLNNATGYRIKVLLDREIDAGFHSIPWEFTNEEGEQPKDGIYIIRLQFGEIVDLKILFALS